MKDSAIIGGGIAGLALGLAAARLGRSIPIFEAKAHAEADEGLIWLAPNGLFILSELGLLDAVLAKACPQTEMIFANRQLRTLTSLHGEDLRKSYGFPIVTLARGDLHAILYEAFLQAGGTMSFHRPFRAEDARAFRYKIAADGIGSAVRRRVFPEARVHYQGICTYLGQSSVPFAAEYKGRTIEAWGLGTRLMLTSVDGSTIVWSAMIKPSVYQKNSDPIPDDFLQFLETTFSDYHPHARALFPRAEGLLQRCNFGEVRGLASYARDGVCLIGDAAHAMPPNMGQGASLAMEDAWLLADLLHKSATVDQAFQLYSRMRMARVKPIMSMANGMNRLFQPSSRILAQLRDWAATCISSQASVRRMSATYAVPKLLARQI